MGLFAKRTAGTERSVAEIEADLEHYRKRHALDLLTIRTLLLPIRRTNSPKAEFPGGPEL